MSPDPVAAFPSSLATVLLAVACVSHLIIALVAGLIARAKERSLAGWAALGVLFGIFALLLILCFPRREESFSAGHIVALVLVFGIPVVMLPVIGLLAAIAIPNFLEAQTRSKVARSKSELRSLALALEMHHVDNGTYPSDDQFPGALTTPTAYLSSILVDPFALPQDPGTYYYRLGGTDEDPNWTMWGVGPDKVNDQATIEYDASNGTSSRGDIIRHGP
jgi:type II secretory pathway pseudopilin PulG